jgi:hypothetical protein
MFDVTTVRCGIHVQHPAPHLVEDVLPEAPALLDQRLDLHGLGI